MIRLVEYVLPLGPRAGGSRPAVIVYTHSVNVVNLQVFTDSGDRGGNDNLHPVEWVQNVEYDRNGGLGTWHYAEDIEHVREQPRPIEYVRAISD